MRSEAASAESAKACEAKQAALPAVFNKMGSPEWPTAILGREGMENENGYNKMVKSGRDKGSQDGGADGDCDDRDGGSIGCGRLADGPVGVGACRGVVGFDFDRRAAGGQRGIEDST